MIRNLACLTMCVAGATWSQPAATLRFEVASVKPSVADPSDGNSGGHSGRGRVTMTNVTLQRCIMGAYGIGPNQIVGGPGWLQTDRWEIVAAADRPVDGDVLMVMLQNLLADRFKLALHREARTVPAFVLEVAKGGPKLEQAADGEARTRNSRGLIDARAMTMNRFAEVLSRQMDLPVVNRTGLEGAFNLRVEWDPERASPQKPGADSIAPPAGPSIYTAIQQQLGLRLQAQKAPIQMLVIDHAERPSEN